MADIVKNTSELKLVAGFYDGDTRTLTLDNPIGSLSAADIHAVETTMKTSQPIIGDKGGANFVGFQKAEIINRTRTILDLG